jgi:hypothetical protein
MAIVRATEGAQVEVQWDGERWGRNFLSSCFMWWKLYPPSSVYFLNKKYVICVHNFLDTLYLQIKKKLIKLKDPLKPALLNYA